MNNTINNYIYRSGMNVNSRNFYNPKTNTQVSFGAMSARQIEETAVQFGEKLITEVLHERARIPKIKTLVNSFLPDVDVKPMDEMPKQAKAINLAPACCVTEIDYFASTGNIQKEVTIFLNDFKNPSFDDAVGLIRKTVHEFTHALWSIETDEATDMAVAFMKNNEEQLSMFANHIFHFFSSVVMNKFFINTKQITNQFDDGVTLCSSSKFKCSAIKDTSDATFFAFAGVKSQTEFEQILRKNLIKAVAHLTQGKMVSREDYVKILNVIKVLSNQEVLPSKTEVTVLKRLKGLTGHVDEDLISVCEKKISQFAESERSYLMKGNFDE